MVKLNAQRNLIKSGVERKTLIQVTKDGVIVDGHHGARAALEAGKCVDVEVVNQSVVESEMSLSELPIRGQIGLIDFIKSIFE